MHCILPMPMAEGLQVCLRGFPRQRLRARPRRARGKRGQCGQEGAHGAGTEGVGDLHQECAQGAGAGGESCCVLSATETLL